MLAPGTYQTLTMGTPINRQAPLNRDLLAWWRVRPHLTGGRTWHELTGRYPATFTNIGASTAVSGWGPTTRAGGWGEVRLDGANDYLTTPAMPALSGATAWTMSAWLNQTTLAAEAGVFFYATTSPALVAVETWSDNLIYFDMGPSGIACPYTTLVAARTWWHLAVVFQGSGATNQDKQKIYVNGQVLTPTVDGGTVPSSFPVIPTTPVQLGFYVDTTSTWNGAMDDVRMSLRAFSAAEVQAVYHAGLLGYPQELTWQLWPTAVGVASRSRPPRHRAWSFWRRAA